MSALTKIIKRRFSQVGMQAPRRQREEVVEIGDHIYILIISRHLELKISSRIILLERKKELRGTGWLVG